VRVDRSDLVPERRELVVLPDLSSTNPNAYVTVAGAAEELYVDIAADLALAVAASTAAESAVPHQASIEFGFLPPLAVGDMLSFAGRFTALPAMIAGSVDYSFQEGCPTRVSCTASTSVRSIGRERRQTL